MKISINDAHIFRNSPLIVIYSRNQHIFTTYHIHFPYNYIYIHISHIQSCSISHIFLPYNINHILTTYYIYNMILGIYILYIYIYIDIYTYIIHTHLQRDIALEASHGRLWFQFRDRCGRQPLGLPMGIGQPTSHGDLLNHGHQPVPPSTLW
jgi:hypothetical protein